MVAPDIADVATSVVSQFGMPLVESIHHCEQGDWRRIHQQKSPRLNMSALSNANALLLHPLPGMGVNVRCLEEQLLQLQLQSTSTPWKIIWRGPLELPTKAQGTS